MKTLKTIYKIELIKLLKRKDWLSILAITAISILFGASILSKGYIGPREQSAILWVVSQIYNTCIFFITPMVFAYTATQMMSTEIENKSILLYTIRFRNKTLIYLGKSFAVISYATIVFIVTSIINLLIYYILATQNQTIISGEFIGKNSIILFVSIITFYFAAFIVPSQFALFVSAHMKTPATVGIIFLVELILHNTYKIPYLQNINPWYYVVRINNEIMDNPGVIVSNYTEKIHLLYLLVPLSIVYILIFNILGAKKLKRSELG